MFDKLLDEFNRLAAANLLGVRMEKSQTAPDPTGPGANVSLDVSNGTCAFFDENGNPTTTTLDVSVGKFHGRTPLLTFAPFGSEKVTRAFIFLNANPQASHGRTFGPPVRMAMGLHELIHACGLRETDPGHGTPDAPVQSDGDLFATGGVAQLGSTPDKDQLFVGGKMGPDRTGQFFLSSRTVSLIQSIWLLGQF
jgi:hypothetical protein